MTIYYLVYKTCFYKSKTKYVLMEKKNKKLAEPCHYQQMSNSVNFTFLQNPEIKHTTDIVTAAELGPK